MQHNNDYFSKLIEKSEVVIKNRVPGNTLRRRVYQPITRLRPENDVTFLERDWHFHIGHIRAIVTEEGRLLSIRSSILGYNGAASKTIQLSPGLRNLQYLDNS